MKRLLPLLAAALAACAYFPYFQGITLGLSESEVVGKLGTPAERRALPAGGFALEYPQEPLGFENWRVLLGPDGRVTAVEQLIDETHFARILPGLSRAEVLRTLGRHSEEKGYRNLDETVLSWRYREFGSRLMFFNAHFDGSGRLKYASRTEDPAMHMSQDSM